MPSPRKILLNNSTIFVTISIEQGLIFVPNPLTDLIIRDSLARAYRLHPVTICHMLVMATHIHFLMVVENPDDIKNFLGVFKTESAHRINRILGRKKRTIWCKGYDSPTILDVDKVLEKISYIYTNPVEANLIEMANKFPGFSSIENFISNVDGAEQSELFKIFLPVLNRTDYSEVPRHNANYYEKAANEIAELSKNCVAFSFNPNAWMDCFNISDLEERQYLNKTILAKIAQDEILFKEERKKNNLGVMGLEKLLNQKIDTLYLPDRTGKRMYCLSKFRELRKCFIEKVKTLIRRAKETFEGWQAGQRSLEFPAGLFPPGFPKLANLFTG